MPRPKWYIHTRLTNTRAVSGFVGARNCFSKLQPTAAFGEWLALVAREDGKELRRRGIAQIIAIATHVDFHRRELLFIADGLQERIALGKSGFGGCDLLVEERGVLGPDPLQEAIDLAFAVVVDAIGSLTSAAGILCRLREKVAPEDVLVAIEGDQSRAREIPAFRIQDQE